MKNILAIIAVVTVATASLGPAQASSQIRRLVAQEIDAYAQGVDVHSLSNAQVVAIYSTMHSKRTEGDKALLIRSLLGGPNTLRGLLFGG